MNNPATFVTGTASFGRCSADGHELFKVTAGVPAQDALQKVSCYIEAVLSVANDIGMGDDPDTSIWAVINLLEMIQASVWAVLDGLPRSPAKAQGAAS